MLGLAEGSFPLALWAPRLMVSYTSQTGTGKKTQTRSIVAHTHSVAVAGKAWMPFGRFKSPPPSKRAAACTA